jgi:hypothetical protein
MVVLSILQTCIPALGAGVYAVRLTWLQSSRSHVPWVTFAAQALQQTSPCRRISAHLNVATRASFARAAQRRPKAKAHVLLAISVQVKLSPSSVRWASTVQVLATRNHSSVIRARTTLTSNSQIVPFAPLVTFALDGGGPFQRYARLVSYASRLVCRLRCFFAPRATTAAKERLRSIPQILRASDRFPVRLARSVLAALHTTSRLIGSHREYINLGRTNCLVGPRVSLRRSYALKGRFAVRVRRQPGALRSAIKAIIVPQVRSTQLRSAGAVMLSRKAVSYRHFAFLALTRR